MRLPTWITDVLGQVASGSGDLRLRKRIGRSDIIGEQGIAHIRRMVLDMGMSSTRPAASKPAPTAISNCAIKTPERSAT